MGAGLSDTSLGGPDKSDLDITHRGDGWMDFPAQIRHDVTGHPNAMPNREGRILEDDQFPLLGCHDTVRETLDTWAYG